jgi:hypothetical protein
MFLYICIILTKIGSLHAIIFFMFFIIHIKLLIVIFESL